MQAETMSHEPRKPDQPEEAQESSAEAPSPRLGISRFDSIRYTALYVGLVVLTLQLLFVYVFFPSYEEANTQLASASSRTAQVVATQDQPDILQWAGAQSLTWISALFAPDTPVRLAPALIFFLVAGGFFASMFRASSPGGILRTILDSAWHGMRVWPSWLGGAAILMIYLVTSSGGIEALRVAAGITFFRSWSHIGGMFVSHWLIYLAWFALLGFLPMLGGLILGLLRTRLLVGRLPGSNESEKDQPTVAPSHQA